MKYAFHGRSRQIEAINKWLIAHQPVQVSVLPGGRIVISWTENYHTRTIQAKDSRPSFDDLLAWETLDEWERMEQEDRDAQPTYDRT